jgi:CheY-like chemotaxis protein
MVAGCDIVEASNGRHALTKALVRPPSLVITEIALPLIDGAALCDILRADWMTKDVPILVVTSDSREAEWARLRRAGADLVLHEEADRPTLRSEAIPLLMQGKTLRERSSGTFERAAAQIER